MVDVRFYHLTRKSLEQALPELLEKVLARAGRAVVMTGSAERAEALTQHLWTYNPNHFLPHGNAKDGHKEDQPIWLTSEDERPNDAGFLFLVDTAQTTMSASYERICDIFDGTDRDALAAARQRWGAAKLAGHKLSYWQQTDQGWIDATPPDA